jgi:hypothetical protein
MQQTPFRIFDRHWRAECVGHGRDQGPGVSLSSEDLAKRDADHD